MIYWELGPKFHTLRHKVDDGVILAYTGTDADTEKDTEKDRKRQTNKVRDRLGGENEQNDGVQMAPRASWATLRAS